jgi:hypothetical protein
VRWTTSCRALRRRRCGSITIGCEASATREDDIRELMATVLLFYIWHTQRGDIYSYDDYVAELARLPEIDWHDDSDDSDIHT